MLGVIKLILNGTQTRAGLTTVGLNAPEAPELAGLIRWSSERKGGEIKSEDGIDKLHCVRERVRSVEESGKTTLLRVESGGLGGDSAFILLQAPLIPNNGAFNVMSDGERAPTKHVDVLTVRVAYRNSSPFRFRVY